MPSTLPISRLVAVNIVLTPAGATGQNLSTLLLLGSTDVIDPVERYRDYNTLAAVAADFGTSAPEYLAAALYFGQQPQPARLKIGRWVNAASRGELVCAPRSTSQQAIGNFTSITNGSFVYTRDGGSPTTVTGLNFSTATNLNGVASTIQAALTGMTVTWNAVYRRFEFFSNTTGPTSSVSFLTAAGSGTDISSLVGGRNVAGSGAYVVPGQAAETALQAVTFFDSNYGQTWYALVVLGAANADHLAIAPYIEASNSKHIYGITTQEPGTIVSASTTDLAYLMSQLAYNRTLLQWSLTNPYAVVSLIARAINIDYNGSNTVLTLAFKQQPGVVSEGLNPNQADVLITKRCNAFLAFNNNTSIVLTGAMSSGNFIDVVTGTDWLAVTLQNSLYNLLYSTTTKVPQTDAGTQLMVTTCESVLSQAVTNGLLAPGVWNSTGFGQLKQGDYLAKGFYVFAPRVDSQSQSDRAARRGVPLQVAAKLSGAVHDISVGVTVNQ